MNTGDSIKDVVRKKYGEAASRVQLGGASCCGGSAGRDPITADLYCADEAALVPEEAVRASLGCGNPTALAELKPGEVVLDLGSGGGVDVLLSARRVGKTGKAYGLDMTGEMLELARENQRKSGLANVEFLEGHLENIPLPGNSVDVIISNCVINLAADKDRVLSEAYRVLKPGGRLAVSDIVVRGEVPPEICQSMELWIGCIAGALEENEYRSKLRSAGFDEIDIEPTRIYRVEDAREFLGAAGVDVAAIAGQIDGKFMSAFIRAVKPLQAQEKDNRVVKRVQIFDPPLCCSSGVCGPDVDPALPRFAADLQWLANQHVAVERYNLAQQPQAFATNEIVKAALQQRGNHCLPLILVDGRMASQGAYSMRDELARLVGLDESAAPGIYSEAVAELVAIGAAIASNCEPCFRFHYDKARKLGVSNDDMMRAVNTAQGVKESPARSVLELANKYLNHAQHQPAFPVMQSSCCAPEPGKSSQGCC